MENNLTIVEQQPKDGSYIIDELNKMLNEKYSLIYNKGYKYYEEDGEYSLYLYMNNQDRPIIFSGQFDNIEVFKDYVLKEMDRRKLFVVKYFNLYRVDQNKGE